MYMPVLWLIYVQGGDAKEVAAKIYGGGSAAPKAPAAPRAAPSAPAPPPPPPPAAAKPRGPAAPSAGGGLFAEINKGADVTKGMFQNIPYPHLAGSFFGRRLINSERQTSCILGELGVSSPFLFKISGFNTDRIIRIEEGIKRPDDSQEPRPKRVQCCKGCWS